MEISKKKWLIAVGALIILAVAGISRLLPSYSSTLKANWGISLPVKARLTEEYEKDSGASFHGDGIRYHVFSYKYEYIDLMKTLTALGVVVEYKKVITFYRLAR